MTQLEEIQKLYAKVKTYKIPKIPKEGQEQAKIGITPFPLDDMETLDMKEGASMSEMSQSMKKMMAKALGVKEEAIGPMSFEYIKEVMEAIMDANNFNEEDAKKTGIKDFIKSKQKLIAAKKKQEEDGVKPNREA